MKKSLIVIIIFILVDFLTKRLFENMTLVVSDLLKFTLVENTGISFGLFQGYNILFIFISLAIFVLIIKWKDEFRSEFAFLLIISGLLGNLIDRILFGRVTDFITFNFFPSFNLADSYITIAVVILIIYEIRFKYKSVA